MLVVSDGLAVTYQPEGSLGICELHVSACVPPFAGAAVGYFNDPDLRDWARALQTYPWKRDARIRVSAAVGDQETVSLAAFVVTGRGQLAVAVHLAVIDGDDHSPTLGIVTETRLLVPTSYQAVATFAHDLAAAIANTGGTAHLGIDRLE
ncbi:hypothetical protein IU500_19245 [Nocardia terpenica]|uniref:hypothetical protein n=1 Tax=Nocardia terpenica TaxID=455432 RepID=UPI001894C3D7|nr:hypothetical protein [Nocardia terpenica]MBF6062026.1 hypothetical protein [Nocardia terpenica]MBF6106174.1 hypothetical protein [Nocardia terpenica]MBF6110446.1 hypothetical protein [Nocardia terpenica]MBF6120717.1 hypothetical protein [Nocardia terpenica]MBF6151782.1 hypothetical protein [Nocardia terpenica]